MICIGNWWISYDISHLHKRYHGNEQNTDLILIFSGIAGKYNAYYAQIRSDKSNY